MSNSPLVVHTNISPNKTSPRNHVIDTITIHCIVGQLSAESLGKTFERVERQASSNYGVDKDGRVGMYVEEKDRSWCSSSRDNDHRAITIEVACDSFAPYTVNEKAYKALIELCADICKRNGIKKLLWKNDKSLIGHVDQQNMTVHRWFAATECPGAYLFERQGDIAAKVNAILGSEVPAADPVVGTQGTELKNLTPEQMIAKVGKLFTEDQRKTGVLASVSLAQFILESGWGKGTLAQAANNFFGMKATVSGNSWAGSAWDGKSVYNIQTGEYTTDGSYVTVNADFRKYADMESSIADHSAYLIAAMKGSVPRYAGLKGCTDYKTAVQIIKDGGYATDPNYVSKLCNLIEKYNLTVYDAGETISEPVPEAPVAPSLPYLVRVKIPNLRIRKGAGVDKTFTNIYTGKGVFTIVEEAQGAINSKGQIGTWGKLKSGAGWICLAFSEYTERL